MDEHADNGEPSSLAFAQPRDHGRGNCDVIGSPGFGVPGRDLLVTRAFKCNNAFESHGIEYSFPWRSLRLIGPRTEMGQADCITSTRSWLRPADPLSVVHTHRKMRHRCHRSSE